MIKRKLAGFGLAFAATELAAAYLPPLVLLPVAAVLLLALCVWARLRPWRCLLLGAALGCVWAFGFQLCAVRPVTDLAGQTLHCKATVETDCESSYQDGALRGTLRLQEIDGRKVDVRVYCKAFPAIEAGERFTADFAFSALPEDDYRLGNYAKGVYLAAEYTGAYEAGAPSAELRFTLYRLRRALAQKLGMYLPRILAGLEAAMLLGDKSGLSDGAREIFRTAGVSHLLAVSGLHVALLCGMFSFGKKRRFSRPLLILQGLIVLFYMLLTGLPVSVLRAGIIFLIALLGYYFLQPPDLLTSLGFAAVLLGLQNAYLPCDIGFQLSFCGVLGVQGAAFFTRRQRALLTAGPTLSKTKKRAIKVLFPVLEGIETAIFATLATMPVLVAHGLTTSGIAVLSNLLVVWMLQPALLLGLLVLGLGIAPVLAPAAHMASLLLAVLLKIMYQITAWCAALPLSHLCLPKTYTLFAFAVLGLLLWLFFHARRYVQGLAAAALCGAMAIALGVALQRDVVTLALVGTSGNPCAVITQNGQAAVIFRGGAANQRAVRSYLAENGAPKQTVVLDLRQQPQELVFDAPVVYTLAEMSEDAWAVPLLQTVTADCVHTGKMNLVVLDVAGYHIAMTAGNAALETPVQVDVLCGGGSYPKSVQAKTILLNTRTPRWLDAVGEETLLYTGDDETTLVLRPGRSARFQEVTTLAVQ